LENKRVVSSPVAFREIVVTPTRGGGGKGKRVVRGHLLARGAYAGSGRFVKAFIT